MPDSKGRCIVVLSSKSSGSSILQRILTRFEGAHHVASTRHFESETLYWVKAAAILERPQFAMLDSEVPIPRARAKTELIDFIRENVGPYEVPVSNVDLVFGGWKRLCRHYGPIFVEKSPHHLHQWSALELIKECMARHPEIDFLIVGLLRNPMAVLYSSWDRMRTPPEENQFEWLTAYRNLLKFQSVVGEKMVIVRYEDMVADPSCLRDVFNFMEVICTPEDMESFHRRSIHKWKDDRFYGFQLSESVAALARELGYSEDDLANEGSILWPAYRGLPLWLHRTVRRVRKAI